MTQTKRPTRKGTRGISTVEFALVAPLLMLMMVGAADFSRVFFHAITLSNSAGTGSFFGAQNVAKSVQYGMITFVTEADASDLEDITVAPEIYCECPPSGDAADETASQEVACTETECNGGYGAPRVFAKTRVTQSFEPMVKWPGIPNPIVISREVYTRVQ